MGDVDSDRVDPQAVLLEELKYVRRLGFWEFRARDCPNLARICGPAPPGEPPEIPIRARLLDLIDPAPLDDRGRPQPRVALERRPRADRGLFGRILFGEPHGVLRFPDGPSGQILTVAPRNLQLTDRYTALAKLRGVSESTINKTPKQREPRGGQAHQLMLDVVEMLTHGRDADEKPPAQVSSADHLIDNRRLRPHFARGTIATVAAACAAILAVGVAWAAGAFDGSSRPSGCVLLDVSSSTARARADYLTALAQFATKIGTSGSGRLCLIRMVGNPLTQSRPTVVHVGPDDHGDALLDGFEVHAKVERLVAAEQRVLGTPVSDGRGSGIVEATLAASAFLNPGDRLLILSDGIQNTATTGDFNRIDLSTTGIDSLLASLESRGFIADLRGVAIQMPLLLYTPGISFLNADRAIRIRAFWKAWARRSGGIPADDV